MKMATDSGIARFRTKYDRFNEDAEPVAMHEQSKEGGPLCDPKWGRIKNSSLMLAGFAIVADEDVTCGACVRIRKGHADYDGSLI